MPLPQIKRLIIDVTGTPPLKSSINELISICRWIAFVYLRRRVKSGKLNLKMFQNSLEDLALDCIADIFQQDEEGNLVQIKSYFDGFPIDKISEPALNVHIRRLVFTRVNQNIFRLYNEIDPILGKILRNVKLSIQALNHFSIIERFGETYILPTMCEPLEHLPMIEEDFLESQIRLNTKAKDNIPSLLSKFSLYLREQNTHSRLISIISVGKIIRSIYLAANETQDSYSDSHFVISDAGRIIDEVCSQLMNNLEEKYVTKKKIDSESFKNYFEVIKNNLYQIILQQDGEPFSFYDRLHILMPKMSKENYKHYHRAKIEYLAKVAYRETVKKLRGDI
jgi:hypothetical protein